MPAARSGSADCPATRPGPRASHTANITTTARLDIHTPEWRGMPDDNHGGRHLQAARERRPESRSYGVAARGAKLTTMETVNVVSRVAARAGTVSPVATPDPSKSGRRTSDGRWS